MSNPSNTQNHPDAAVFTVAHSPVDDQGRRVVRRGNVDRLLELSRYLPQSQRTLIERKLRLGLSARQIALLTGEHPRVVQRHLRSTQQRLRDPLFVFVAEHRQRLPAPMRLMATSLVLKQLPLRIVAATTGQTLHEVRKQASALRAMVASHRVWASLVSSESGADVDVT